MHYLKCSQVFLWKRRKEGKIKSVNAGKKVLIVKSSVDEFLNNKNKIDNNAVCENYDFKQVLQILNRIESVLLKIKNNIILD